jgi:hypothetical protein
MWGLNPEIVEVFFFVRLTPVFGGKVVDMFIKVDVSCWAFIYSAKLVWYIMGLSVSNWFFLG